MVAKLLKNLVDNPEESKFKTFKKVDFNLNY